MSKTLKELAKEVKAVVADKKIRDQKVRNEYFEQEQLAKQKLTNDAKRNSVIKKLQIWAENFIIDKDFIDAKEVLQETGYSRVTIFEGPFGHDGDIKNDRHSVVQLNLKNGKLEYTASGKMGPLCDTTVSVDGDLCYAYLKLLWEGIQRGAPEEYISKTLTYISNKTKNDNIVHIDHGNGHATTIVGK